jgi:hypothetical protein
MNYKIVTTDDFERKFKHLRKKYISLTGDYENFLKELRENPKLGVDLGGNTRKVRMAIASKGKGKRGGARIITCNVLVSIQNTDIYLLTIYDKGEKDNISTKEIAKLKRESGL